MRHVIAGTAGHIDHGKTELVRALTGVDCDRLSEEKERGITIDIGFAPLILDDNLHVGFVDVPGHERFVKNMLAGASGIDLVVLVVAADESVKPQTREHFDVCRLLGVGAGLVALTKSDLVDGEMQELVALEIKELVKGSFLDGAPIIPVSSVTGAGLEQLKEALAERARRTPPRSSVSIFRLPVDRAFSIKGFGTVITGTLSSGSVREGQEVAIYPGGQRARVRGVQIHGETAEEAVAGQRTALNLQGVDTAHVERGDVLAPPESMRPSSLLDVRLRLLPDARGPLKDLARVRYHQGTSEILARVKLLQKGALEPGAEGYAQLRLERPAASLPGDRFVIRRYSPMFTLGGGVVLDAHPEKHRGISRARLDRLGGLKDGDPGALMRDLLDRSASGATPEELVIRTGLKPDEVDRHAAALCRTGDAISPESGGFMLSAGCYARLWERAREILVAFHDKKPLMAGLPREELLQRILPEGAPDVRRFVMERMAAEGKIRLEKDVVASARHQVALGREEERILQEVEEEFRAGGLNPGTLEEIVQRRGLHAGKARTIYHLLLSRGRLLRIKDGKVFHAGAIERLKTLLWDRRERHPAIDVATFKELTGTSRKNAIPLLEHLDAERVTRRRQNDREILPPPRVSSA
jgi:selenocysteine-specific elongation factor